jgi:O-Antigen ligase.
MDTAAADSIFGWLAVSIVLAGILSAWADPLSSHSIHAAALALAGVWLALAVRSGNLCTPWLLFPILAAAAWGGLQLLAHGTVSQFATVNMVTAWLARGAVFQVAFASLGSRSIRQQIFSVLLYAGSAIAISAILQHVVLHDSMTGTFLNRDHYAVLIELLLPLALTRALLAATPGMVPMAIAATLFASVIACGARAGAALISLETLLIAAVAIRRGSHAFRSVAVLAAGIAVCTGIVGWQFIWLRLQDTDLFTVRRELLASTLQMTQARPWTGFGLGAWPAVYPAFAVFDPPGIFMNHAHNDWAEWLADGGIPYAACLAAIAAGSLSLVRKAWWALGVPAALLHSFVDFPMQKASLALLAFFLLGAAAAKPRVSSKF